MELDAAYVRALYAVATALTVVLGYVVWRHREKAGALPLFGSIAGAAWWSAGLFLASVIPDPGVSVLLNRLIFVGVVTVVASIALFALEYTGREHLVTRRTVALLSIHPVVVVALALTNPGDVFYASMTVDPSAVTGVAVVWGTAFWVHAAYSYAVTMVVAALVIEMLYRSRALYRGQIVALVAAVLSPSLANLPSLLNVVSFDSTPLGFVVANALFTLAITRYRLIDLAPIARDRVLDTVEDAVYVVDREHRIVDVNPAAEALAEQTMGDVDVVGRDVRDFLKPLPETYELYRDIVESGEERSTEFPLDGRHYDVEATTIDDGRGRHVGWLFLVRDITERKRREQELQRRNEQLDEFANVVSHDLRNPLNVANGYVDLARETGDTSHLDEVDATLDRMEAIIDDVLALAREGEDVTDPAPVDLGSAAEAAWGNVDTGDASLRVADAATVDADRDRLVRLLENLFRNSVEHGTRGCDGEGSAVGVEVGAIGDNGAAAGFYVADDGRGIPPDERGQVFDSGYTTDEGGTGFGLAIVEQIADAHGWRAEVTDSEAGGARFEFRGVPVESSDRADRVRAGGT
ncbi:PAS domain-containing protein [Halostella sp. JP-L12]|uniref:histidine kinase N-terminal 7TM domain-containing protein n=1 Tax=Halostella TaxID=1843185 RepID=UPI0013CEE983|nr:MULTISPECIES: histidine kinase N-terminal 7TM domain-containing protein [Halostella]NHN47439.1 PAS domain-containing protein [Halostella sp. JP-L12]